MAATITAERALRDVQRGAEKIKNDELQRFPEAASPGDSVRQGDVYVTLLDRVPAGATPIPFRAQLADGNTQGSRHCLDSSQGVQLYRLPEPGMLDGPVVELAEPRTLEHPEHGDWLLGPGVYQISYQRSLDAEDRERRSLD